MTLCSYDENKNASDEHAFLTFLQLLHHRVLKNFSLSALADFVIAEMEKNSFA